MSSPEATVAKKNPTTIFRVRNEPVLFWVTLNNSTIRPYREKQRCAVQQNGGFFLSLMVVEVGGQIRSMSDDESRFYLIGLTLETDV